MFIYSWKLLAVTDFFVMHPGSYFTQSSIWTLQSTLRLGKAGLAL